jgi:hypothetical protein
MPSLPYTRKGAFGSFIHSTCISIALGSAVANVTYVLFASDYAIHPLTYAGCHLAHLSAHRAVARAQQRQCAGRVRCPVFNRTLHSRMLLDRRLIDRRPA